MLDEEDAKHMELQRQVWIQQYLRMAKFNRGYLCILIHFKRIFERISQGGDVDIKSKNPKNPFTDGI